MNLTFRALTLSLLILRVAAPAQQASPTSSPTPPPLVGTLAAHPDWPPPRNPSDVDSLDHLVSALYEVISGPAGQPRDWTRFRSLFLPDARLGVVRPSTPASSTNPASTGDAVFLTPDMYVQRDDPYFRTHGFFEHSIANRVETFSNLTHVWSTYESRHAASDPQPFARGINSIQIVRADNRFWIAAILWEEERPGTSLPGKYLPAAPQPSH